MTIGGAHGLVGYFSWILWVMVILRPFIESTTDIGLPRDQSRDNGWNTNNPIESAFRVFDLVFLNLLQNKRWALLNYHNFTSIILNLQKHIELIA